MNILIIGGTRFIGPFVINQLVQKGHQVAVFNRGTTPVNLSREVKFIKGNRESIEEQVEEFKKFQPEVVLDMIPFTETEAKRTLSVFQGIAKRIVAVSSADVYRAFGRLIGTETGEIIPTPSFEQSPLREKLYPYREKVDESDVYYHYDKILVEKAYLSDPHIAGTILRLPMVYGPGDKQHRLFPYIKRIKDGRDVILLDEDLAKWKTGRGYVENVAFAITLAIENHEASGEIYNVVENNFTEEDWVNHIGNLSKWSGRVEIIPSGYIPLDSNVKQSIDLSSEKIRSQLGYTEMVPFEEGLLKTIEWETQHFPEHVDEQNFNYKQEDSILIETSNKN